MKYLTLILLALALSTVGLADRALPNSVACIHAPSPSWGACPECYQPNVPAPPPKDTGNAPTIIIDDDYHDGTPNEGLAPCTYATRRLEFMSVPWEPSWMIQSLERPDPSLPTDPISWSAIKELFR